MADDGVFCTTAEVQMKVGENASATSNVEGHINSFVSQAESYINIVTRHNWTDDYASLNVDVKCILKEAASNLAACYVIMYDMFGYTQLEEAQTMINLLMARFDSCMALLRDQKVKDFIEGET